MAKAMTSLGRDVEGELQSSLTRSSKPRQHAGLLWFARLSVANNDIRDKGCQTKKRGGAQAVSR